MEEPRLLIVETSGRIGQVALALGEVLRRVRPLDETRRHARDLAPAVAALLKEEEWLPRDLDGVLVSRGPGSYTGLRVGIMSCKALAYATGCALLAVDTFAAIALQAPPEATRLAVLADAQQQKAYVQLFARSSPGGALLAEGPLTIRNFKDWIGGLEGSVWVSGPALRLYRDHLPDKIRVTEEGQWDPRPESLLALGLARYRKGERDDLWALEPLYLRPSSAEEKWREGTPPKVVAPVPEPVSGRIGVRSGPESDQEPGSGEPSQGPGKR